MTKKGMKRASADVGFIFIAYNLRRIINILGHEVLKKFLKELALLFSQKSSSINQSKVISLIPFLEKATTNLFLKAA